MRPTFVALVATTLLLLSGCATLPPEAAELSAQIGARLNSLEAAQGVDDFGAQAETQETTFKNNIRQIIDQLR